MRENKARPKRGTFAFHDDESGQATTEYVLILAVILAIAILVIRDLVRPALEKLTGWISNLIENKMFRPGSMHKSPFRMPPR